MSFKVIFGNNDNYCDCGAPIERDKENCKYCGEKYARKQT